LAQADSWTTVEREILPAGLEMAPPFWLKLAGIRSPDICTSMHDMYVVTDLGAFTNIDG
jgi:hypothetical protein